MLGPRHSHSVHSRVGQLSQPPGVIGIVGAAANSRCRRGPSHDFDYRDNRRQPSSPSSADVWARYPVEAMRVSLCLRDEEANASSTGVAGGSLTELP